MIGIVMTAGELRNMTRRAGRNRAYYPLANKYKVNLCLYTPGRISKDGSIVHGRIYTYADRKLIEKKVPIPKVNLCLNTAYIRNKKALKKMIKLEQHSGIPFINCSGNNRRNKLKNNEYLSSAQLADVSVPETARLSLEALDDFLARYDKLIIKPLLGSKGKNIAIVSKANGGYFITGTHPSLKPLLAKRIKQGKHIFIPKHELPLFYSKHFKKPSAYMVQQWIQFMTYGQKPFDLRVIVQKNNKNNWQVTSCMGRVSRKKGFITNLNQGGGLYTLRQLGLYSLRKKIIRAGLEIAKQFEEKYPHAADIGLDLGLDRQRCIYFIEANFCSMKEKWETQFQLPFEHAYSQLAQLKVAGRRQF